MRDDLEARRRTALGEPVINPLIDEPVVERRIVETRSGSNFWLPALFGIFVVLGILYYLNAWGPLVERTASNTTTIINTTKTEKIIPPATPAKPATQPTQAQPATQPQ